MNDVSPPPLIEVEGPVADRGRQYGRIADTRIKNAAAYYQGLLDVRGIRWGAVMDTARLLLASLNRTHPAQYAEILAIADGSGTDPAEVLLINGRSEILNAGTIDVPAKDCKDLDDGCTAAAVLPERTAEGRLLHGQNWDWRPECADFTVVLVVRREDGPDVMSYVEAGGLARAGMNSIGVSITGNNLSTSNESWEKPGVPLSIVRRLALEADSFPGALDAIAQTPRSVSNNMMLGFADDAGEIINLETTPDEIFWQVPEDSILTHANHFVTAAARARVQDRGLLEGMNSLYRDRRVRRLLESEGMDITVGSFQAAFADTFGPPRGVLRAPEAGSNQISATVASIIMDAGAGRMWVRQRPYLPGEYTEFRL